MAFYDLIKRIWNNKQNWVCWVSASECLVCFLIDVCSGVKMRVLHIEPAIALGSIQFDCLWLHSFDDIIYIFCVSFHFCLVCLFTSCCRCCCSSSCCCCCCWQKEASRSDVTCTATRAPLSASGNGTVTSDNVTSTRRGQHDEPTSTSVAAPSPSPTPTLTAIATATATSSPISTWTFDQARYLTGLQLGQPTHAFASSRKTGFGCKWSTFLSRQCACCMLQVRELSRAAPGRWLSTDWPSCGAQIQQQTGAIHFESFYCERSQGGSRSTKLTESSNRLKARWLRLYVW